MGYKKAVDELTVILDAKVSLWRALHVKGLIVLLSKVLDIENAL